MQRLRQEQQQYAAAESSSSKQQRQGNNKKQRKSAAGTRTRARAGRGHGAADAWAGRGERWAQGERELRPWRAAARVGIYGAKSRRGTREKRRGCSRKSDGEVGERGGGRTRRARRRDAAAVAEKTTRWRGSRASELEPMDVVSGVGGAEAPWHICMLLGLSLNQFESGIVF